MMNAFRRARICGAVLSFAFCAISASAQTSAAPDTPLQKQLDRVDFSISGIGILNKNSSGTTLTPQSLGQVPSNTAGALVELRYIRSPLVGAEFNYTFSRYTQNFTLNNTTGTPAAQLPYTLGVQAQTNEYSMGYVAHVGNFFGLTPYVSLGGGALEFKPTAGGGEKLPPQVRTVFYYAAGIEGNLSQHFGVRAQFRQTFFGAPDFNENYLATGARTTTTEPGVGFYVRF